MTKKGQIRLKEVLTNGTGITLEANYFDKCQVIGSSNRESAVIADGNEVAPQQREIWALAELAVVEMPVAAQSSPTSLGDSLYWSYANLAMAHAAVSAGAKRYGRVHYMIRARLHKGLRAGSMNIGPIAEDEKLKLILPQSCCYCAAKLPLSVDHLLPRVAGGADAGENMVWSCRSCNSSKGKKDVLVWLGERQRFPPILLLRRYLKLAIGVCNERGLLLTPLDTARQLDLPFCVTAIPHQYPNPSELVLWIVPLRV